MNKNRVVVTGLGVYSALGKDISEYWNNAIAGKTAIGPLDFEHIDDVSFKNGAQIKGYDPNDFFERREQITYDTFTHYALISAAEAVQNANLDTGSVNKSTAGVIMGSGIGGQGTQDENYKSLYGSEKFRMNPFTIPRIMPNANASSICMKYGFQGPAYTISSACASGNHAITNAFQLIQNGICDMMFCGGSETPFTYGYLKAWEGIRVVAPDTCKPFDKNRKGMILGEGGGVLILENLSNALKRGAQILAEIVGIGMSADAGHITKPDIDGIKLAVNGALKNAGIQPDQVSHINAHGTGTEANDVTEAQIINDVFGSHAKNIPVTGTKSLHGHGIGATSALEGILTVLSIHHGKIPPTANTTELADNIDIDLVLNEYREHEIEYAMSNSFAFGGLNSVIVFKKFSE